MKNETTSVTIPAKLAEDAVAWMRQFGGPQHLDENQTVESLVRYIVYGHADRRTREIINQEVARIVSQVIAHFSEGALQVAHDGDGNVQIRRTEEHPEGESSWLPVWAPGAPLDEPEPWEA